MIPRHAFLLVSALALSALPLAADDLPAWTPIGPDGGEVGALATSPVSPNTVYAGLLAHSPGVFRSADRGRTWAAAGTVPARNILDLSVGADGREVYAASDTALVRSTDGGVTWSVLDEARYTLVQAHPRRPRTVFAVLAGVLSRSTDGGRTRQPVSGPQGVLSLAFSPGAGTVVWAGAGNGLWKSTDSGRTWRRIDLGLPVPGFVHSIAVDPRDPSVLYAGLIERRRALLKSTDGGATWKVRQRGLPFLSSGTVESIPEIAVDPADSSVVYALVGQHLFRSVDAARTWTRTARPPGLLWHDVEATAHGLLAGTTAGVFLSTDRGLTWQVRTRGLAATTITGLAIDTQDPPRLYAGDALAGVFRTVHRGRPWQRLGEIDEDFFAWARPLQIDPDDPRTVYAGSMGAVAKSTDGGRSWVNWHGPSCIAVMELALDPRQTGRLYASGDLFTSGCGLHPTTCTFFRSADAGETWQCVGGGRERQATLLGVDPFASAVYAQLLEGHLARSTDGGETWTRIFDALSADAFAASPLVEGTLWAGELGRVRRSRDGGLTWQDFTAGLPDAYVAGLAPDPQDPGVLYAATERSGVFRSTDAGETWTPAGAWPADAHYQGGLVVDPADRSILYAGTENRGVLRLDQEEN